MHNRIKENNGINEFIEDTYNVEPSRLGLLDFQSKEKFSLVVVIEIGGILQAQCWQFRCGCHPAIRRLGRWRYPPTGILVETNRVLLPSRGSTMWCLSNWGGCKPEQVLRDAPYTISQIKSTKGEETW
jgi:hypothetical protein